VRILHVMNEVLARRIIVIGASAGGIEALRVLSAGLPPDLPAAVCVVVHTAADAPGILHRILNDKAGLPVIDVTQGMRLAAGRMYVAPPDHHLIVEPGTLRLSKGPKENRFRPAIDPLFRSAAQVFGPAAIGVILTGNLDDGTAGLWAIKQLGGITIVQDPADALYPSMPTSAARHVEVDYSVTLPEIAPLLARLAGQSPDDGRAVPVPESVEVEVKIASEQNAIEAGVERIGDPSPFACPECHGVLLRIKGSHPFRLRCHTGHAYSAESLLAAVSEGIEDALWNAVRALEEGGLLLQHLATHHHERGDSVTSQSLAAKAGEAHRQSNVLRQAVGDGQNLATSREA
jgi:two-component system chemotaxis response regulator CheB